MTELEKRELGCFGCSTKILRTSLIQYRETYKRHLRLKDAGVELAFSYLSDAQELISMGRSEDARQTINQAKYLMSRAAEEILELREDPHEQDDFCGAAEAAQGVQ